MFKLSHRSDVAHVPQQYNRSASQISERSDNSHLISSSLCMVRRKELSSIWYKSHVISKTKPYFKKSNSQLTDACVDSSVIYRTLITGLTRYGSCWLCFFYSVIGSIAKQVKTLRWRHNGHGSVSNHQPQDCLLNHLFRRRSTKTSKLRVTGLSNIAPWNLICTIQV